MTARTLIALLLATTLAACEGDRLPDGLEDTPTAATLHVFDRAAPQGSAANPGQLRFEIVRSGEVSGPATVDYRTEDGSARAGEHYQPRTGRLSFAPGQRRQTVEVPFIGNNRDEPGLYFHLHLVEARGATVVDGQARGHIANDDMPCLLPTLDNPWLDRRPISFAHRGGVREFPENTLYAYRESARLGSDVLEVDIYATADGELVVIHDTTVDRTTEGSGTVEQMTLAELRALDAAYWFVPGRGTPRDAAPEDYVFRGVATGERAPPPGYRAEDFRIPTLEEALQAFPGELINIELKPSVGGTGRYERQVADLLKRYGRATDVMVASFLDHTATLFKLAAPCVSTSVPTVQVAALVATSLGPLPMLPMPLHHAFQVPRSLVLDIVTPDFIADARRVGLAVHVWTIDDCEEMVELLDMGVDGIMTDRPARLQQVLAQPPDQRSCEGVD